MLAGALSTRQRSHPGVAEMQNGGSGEVGSGSKWVKTVKLGRDLKRLTFISLGHYFRVVLERKVAFSGLWPPGKEVVLTCEVFLPFLCALLSSLCLWYLPQLHLKLFLSILMKEFYRTLQNSAGMAQLALRAHLGRPGGQLWISALVSMKQLRYLCIPTAGTGIP